MSRTLQPGARGYTPWMMLPAFLYPHRVFERDVVEHAVKAYLADASATYASVTEEHQCSPRSVWRWVEWLAAMVQARVLLAGRSVTRGWAVGSADPARGDAGLRQGEVGGTREGALPHANQAACALVVWARPQPVPPLDPSPMRSLLAERFLAFREIHRLTVPRPSPRSPEDATGPSSRIR